VFIVGDHANLGSLDASQAVEMTRSGEIWSTSVDLPAGSDISYQYVVTPVGTKRSAKTWQM
jgi:hypothetical protein